MKNAVPFIKKEFEIRILWASLSFYLSRFGSEMNTRAGMGGLSLANKNVYFAQSEGTHWLQLKMINVMGLKECYTHTAPLLWALVFHREKKEKERL